MANNLRKFATESEYNSATLNYPSVSWITSTDTVHFDKVSPIPKKLKLTYSDSSTYDIDCDTETILRKSDVQGGSSSYTAITSAEIGSCVTTIGQGAFQSCTSLASINIPNSVTTINGNVFMSCRNLTRVTVNASTPPTLGAGAFYDTNDCPIYVPAASVNTYKAATNWSTYASRIQAINE